MFCKGPHYIYVSFVFSFFFCFTCVEVFPLFFFSVILVISFKKKKKEKKFSTFHLGSFQCFSH